MYNHISFLINKRHIKLSITLNIKFTFNLTFINEKLCNIIFEFLLFCNRMRRLLYNNSYYFYMSDAKGKFQI